ncbi:cytochrome b5 [Trichonephila clavipes]|nr:cytochrome b5 [Trichonephila clavipes]
MAEREYAGLQHTWIGHPAVKLNIHLIIKCGQYWKKADTDCSRFRSDRLKENSNMSEEKIKSFTLKEIAEHSNSDSAWVLINDGVYDVTKFLDEHPGGPETLLDWAGKEATEAFEDVAHSVDARTLMENYKIGELSEEDQKEKPKANGSSSWCVLQ